MKGILRGRAGRMAATAAVVVVGAVVPTSAQAADLVGGGSVVGTFSYAPGVAVSDCRTAEVEIELTSVAALLPMPDGYLGPLSITASATSHPIFCETIESGGTLAELSVFGENELGDVISCTVSGGFVRVGTILGGDASGPCTLNGGSPITVYFHLGLQWAPAEVDGNGDVVTAAVAGVFWAGR